MGEAVFHGGASRLPTGTGASASTQRRERRCTGAGVLHPSLITPTDIDILNGDYDARSLGSAYGYKDGWGSLGPELAHEIAELLTT